MTNIDRVIGPRIPAEEMRTRGGRYILPTALFLVANAEGDLRFVALTLQ